MTIETTAEFDQAFDLMNNTTDHLFITGKAGTGKSTLLTYFRLNTTKKVVVLAPTGVSALNVAGETIHSFFKLKPNSSLDEVRKKAHGWRNSQLYKTIETIVIDEISMVRADLFDCINVFLQVVNDCPLPFGGKQVICFGDLYQLSPVVTREEKPYFQEVYESPYFFSADVCNDDHFHMNILELTKIYRQKDDRFIDILNHIRDQSITMDQLNHLNQNVDSFCHEDDDRYIYLTTTNANADAINSQKMHKLPSSPFESEADIQGDFDLKMAPTDSHLTIKSGAQIMFLNNDSQHRWVNGSIGHVEEILIEDEGAEMIIRTQDERRVRVKPHKWDVYKYHYDTKKKSLSQEKVGSFTQFPIKCAWAITIHKSQGKTFDRVIIDLGRGAFASGQVYVALSRCRTMEGIRLKSSLRRSDLKLDRHVHQFATITNSNAWMHVQPLEKSPSN